MTTKTGLRFPNNILTSTMQMPTHYERPRFTEPDFDQRSVHSRRDISQMSNIDHRSNYNRWETSSMYGGGEVRAHHFNYRDSVRTMGSRRFVGRSGSPYSVRSRGPRYRNNILTSTMQMPNNYERARFTEPDFDQRSVCSRRDISPMSNIDRRSNCNRWESSSMYGGGDARVRNNRDSVRTMSSRSVFNGRSGSPFSVRSTGPRYRNNILTSTMQMPNNYQRPRFTEPDFHQRSVRSGRDISPMSNIDGRSYCNRWESSSMYGGGDARVRNSRDSVRTMSSRSVFNGRSGSPFSVRSTASKTSESARSIAMAFKNIKFDKDDLRIIKDAFSMYIDKNLRVNKHNAPPQQQRLENGFLLPYYRHNKSTIVSPILESNECAQNYTEIRREMGTTEQLVRNWREESDSEQDEIFERTIREKTIHNHEPERKMRLNDEDNIYVPEKKIHKLSSPVKTNYRIKVTLTKHTNSNSKNKENGKVDNFEFVKPTSIKRPARQSKAKVISKSPQRVLDTVQCVENKAHGQISQPLNGDQEKLTDEPPQANSTSDLSMRPSFIKRKLFTQKLDVTEKHNISGVNSLLSSPQANIYSAIQNEKHKLRKIVTSQSCLSRDAREDNSLLDLMHRIVPPEQMSITNQMNKTETTHNKNNSEDYNDKWDVTSIIDTCNDDNVSDTYTDEEMFTCKRKTNDMRNEQMPASNNNNGTVVRNCNIGKLSDAPTLKNKLKTLQTCETKNVSKKHAHSYVKSYFGIDSDSDAECTSAENNLSHIMDEQGTCNFSSKEMIKNQTKYKPEPRNNTTVKNTLPAPYTILCDEEPDEKDDSRSSLLCPQNKNAKSNQKNNPVSKKQTRLKKRYISTENDACQMFDTSHDDKRILQIVLTPIKIINKKIKINSKTTKVKEVYLRKSDVSFSLVSEKINPIVQKHVDRPANIFCREQLKKTKVRKSDLSFSLLSKNKRVEKKNTAKNNTYNKNVDVNLSMVLRSRSLSSPHEKVKAVKSEARTKPNRSKVYS